MYRGQFSTETDVYTDEEWAQKLANEMEEDKVKQGMKIVPVKTVEDVLKVALVRMPEPIDWAEPEAVVPAAVVPAADAVVTH